MASGKSAWGIDIGNRALKAVRVSRREGNQVVIDDIEVIDHEQLLSQAGDNREALIQTALNNFVQHHQAKGSPVAVSVSGHSSFARFIKLPPVERKKIPEIVRFEAIQQIPFPLDEVEWAYQLFEQPDNPDVEVGIFAIKKELVNQHLGHFTTAGVTVRAVQMSPLAVYNALQFDKKLSATTLIIDMGTENTDLIIADGETVWLRTINIGGNNFTETLAKSFKLEFRKAEELKRTAATSKYARNIFQAMRPVFSDLVAEIQRSIGFYASVHRESRIAKVVMLGGTFRLPTLQKYLTQNLQLEPLRVDGLASAPPDDGHVAGLLNDNLISVAGAYGLALQALGDAKIGSSLLPERIRKMRTWQEKMPLFAATAAVFVLGTVGVGFKWYQLNSDFTAQVKTQKEIDAALVRAQRFDADWKKIAESGAANRALIDKLQGLHRHRNIWPLLINDINDRVPKMVDPHREAVIKVPRGDRAQVTIERFFTQYVPNMNSALAAPDKDFGAMATTDKGGARPDMPGRDFSRPVAPTPPPPPSDGTDNPTPAEPAVQKPRRGFLITIQCTSPNKESAAFIQKNFLRGLESISQTAAMRAVKDTAGNSSTRVITPYYVARTYIVESQQLSTDPKRKEASEAAKQAILAAKQAAEEAKKPPGEAADPNNPGAGPGVGPDRGPGPMRGGMGLPGRNNNNDVPVIPVDPTKILDPMLDPVTGEDMSNDWEYTILVAVVLDPEPPQPQPAADQPPSP